MADKYEKFNVGINIFVVRDGKILLGKRKNIYGDGFWGLPGGHLERGEAMEDAAKRELFEETGLHARNLVFSNIVNDNSNERHYIQVAFSTNNSIGEPAIMEPDRCSAWGWFSLNRLPDNLFIAHVKQIENFINRKTFIDT